MFGYIRIDKDELKVKEYNLFKAYYCGVCRTLKREYHFPAHYFLSYDAAFLAILLTSVMPGAPDCTPIRCMANPLVKRPATKENEALLYAAAANVLLVWFKLKDDWKDNYSLRSLFLMPLMLGKRNKAKRQYPKLYEDIRMALKKLSELEKQKCQEPDAVAAAFGELMAKVFDAPLAQSTDKQRILSHAGFLLGRLIYLLDAWSDKEEDRKKKAYNPFLLAGALNKEELLFSLDYTLSELANTLTLLEPVRHQTIIDNIIYLGMKKTVDSVFEDKHSRNGGIKEKHHERPI